MSKHNVFSGSRGMRLALVIPSLVPILMMAACGGAPNPNAPTVANVPNAAFISNTYTGALQIVNTQNDTTSFTAESTNSAGQVVQGQPVSISVATTVSYEVLSPGKANTLVYDPSTFALYVIANSSQTTSGSLPLAGPASMAAFSPNGATVYAPVPSAGVSGSHPGLVQAWNVSSFANTANYTVPAANSVAVSPNGTYLLVFSNNSDALTVINLSTSPVTYSTISGFARPVNAFFSSDGNTAYVLNCGPECGSSSPASVAQFNIPSQTIVATVPVGGASVGLLNNQTLYVAGSPVPPGTKSTYDAVNISNMTRITTASVNISDGFHTTMALAQNNKLYIGANQCSNTTTGCLSVVNVASNTADAALPPRGPITSLLAITNRNVVYAIEGGYLVIYDTTTDQPQTTQIIFTGALYGIVQVD
jgi:hypothetical protein